MKFFWPLDLQFFAHKKGGGSAATNCNHDSQSKIKRSKKNNGEKIEAGSIIVRQLGSKIHSGENTYMSKDYSIHAKNSGIVFFYQKKIKHRKKTFVKIINLNLSLMLLLDKNELVKLGIQTGTLNRFKHPSMKKYIFTTKKKDVF